MGHLYRSTASRFFTLFIISLGIVSCSFDYQEGMVESETRTGIPQVEVLDVRMVIVRENRVELTADRIATYPEEGIQEFSNMEFREYGPDGSVRIEGSATGGVLYLDTEDIELRGTVRIVSIGDDALLESEFLYWQNADRVLRSNGDETVLIEKGDGTRLEGGGLRMDGRRNVVEFKNGVAGVYYGEESE